jgi:hypothetical protein
MLISIQEPPAMIAQCVVPRDFRIYNVDKQALNEGGRGF